MSPVEFKKYPMLCRSHVTKLCHMSILRNGYVALSNLGVEGHCIGQPMRIDYCSKLLLTLYLNAPTLLLYISVIVGSMVAK